MHRSLLATALALALVAPAGAQTAKPGTVVLTIVNDSGAPVADAVVRMSGPADRGGTSGSDGAVTFQNVPAGTYRARITADGLITFEKEIVVRAGARQTAEARLTPAPPPPAPPPPPPAEPKPDPMPTLKAGDPRSVSLPDLLPEMLRGSQPLVEREIGCSGATTSRVIVARENIAIHRHAEVDEVLYVVAGEATITLADKDQNVEPGWYTLVPRGMSHAIARRGRNPLVLLSIQSGQPCGS
jgi:mannose-6-phosphate isomerase-like protein (cupin superfamily)